mmetsp:Transcript_13225/g.25293  ORF Transcript_13225/g.25293 Transcript_13225/m.25293 type:complete len:301 (-) Transcript_13225:110-1012(-)
MDLQRKLECRLQPCEVAVARLKQRQSQAPIVRHGVQVVAVVPNVRQRLDHSPPHIVPWHDVVHRLQALRRAQLDAWWIAPGAGVQLQVLHPALLVQHEGAHHRQRAPHTLPEILFRARVALPHFQTRGGEPGDDEQGVHGSQALLGGDEPGPLAVFLERQSHRKVHPGHVEKLFGILGAQAAEYGGEVGNGHGQRLLHLASTEEGGQQADEHAQGDVALAHALHHPRAHGHRLTHLLRSRRGRVSHTGRRRAARGTLLSLLRLGQSAATVSDLRISLTPLLDGPVSVRCMVIRSLLGIRT